MYVYIYVYEYIVHMYIYIYLCMHIYIHVYTQGMRLTRLSQDFRGAWGYSMPSALRLTGFGATGLD